MYLIINFPKQVLSKSLLFQKKKKYQKFETFPKKSNYKYNILNIFFLHQQCSILEAVFFIYEKKIPIIFVSKASKLYSHEIFQTQLYNLLPQLNFFIIYIQAIHPQTTISSFGLKRANATDGPKMRPCGQFVQVKHKFGSTGCRQRGTMGLLLDIAH